jgi:hypothetical protein
LDDARREGAGGLTGEAMALLAGDIIRGGRDRYGPTEQKNTMAQADTAAAVTRARGLCLNPRSPRERHLLPPGTFATADPGETHEGVKDLHNPRKGPDLRRGDLLQVLEVAHGAAARTKKTGVSRFGGVRIPLYGLCSCAYPDAKSQLFAPIAKYVVAVRRGRPLSILLPEFPVP